MHAWSEGDRVRVAAGRLRDSAVRFCKPRARRVVSAIRSKPLVVVVSVVVASALALALAIVTSDGSGESIVASAAEASADSPTQTTIDPERIQPTLPEGTDGGGQPFDIESLPACIQVSDHVGAMRGCVDRDALNASPLEEPPWSQLAVTDEAGEITGVFFRGLLGFVPIDVANDPAKLELLDSCVESLLALRVIDAACDASLREGSYR
jgi:hypothetical protein